MKRISVRSIRYDTFAAADAQAPASRVNVPGWGSNLAFHARVKRRHDGVLHRQRFGVALRAVRFTVVMGSVVRVFYEARRTQTTAGRTAGALPRG